MKTNLTHTLLVAILFAFSSGVMAGGFEKNATPSNMVEDSQIQEAPPVLEKWMTTPFTLNTAEDSEEIVRLEDWMIDSELFMASINMDHEEIVELEKWMTIPFTLNTAEDSEEIVRLEDWMTNSELFMASINMDHEEIIELEKWMTIPFTLNTAEDSALCCENQVSL